MKKRILIVDDEEPVLFVLKNSLVKHRKDYEVVTVSNGQLALEHIQLRPFDLIITDYRMPDMNGLEFMQAVKGTHPDARIILMTAYGTEALEREVNKLDAFRYLTKPLDINMFRQIVADALQKEEIAINQPGILVLSDTRYQKVLSLLQNLQADVGGRCIILTDSNGQMIAEVGDVKGLHQEEMSSLLCGGMATFLEAGKLLDDDEDTINLSYREGKRENLYAVNIGSQLLLIIIIENVQFSTRLGSAWYYAQKTAVSLRKTLGELEQDTTTQIFNDTNVDEAFDYEIDKLFNI